MSNQRPCPPPGIYAITPDHGTVDAIAALATCLVERELRLLQVRSKHLDRADRETLARRLRPVCRAAGSLLIINDDVQLAAATDADGVHLGADDGGIAAARAVLGPERWIGASCYADAERATSALAAGADYLAFGAFFRSHSKSTAQRASTSLLRRFVHGGRPLVAIGGIDAHNGAPLVSAGARWLAVIAAIWESPDPCGALDELNTLFHKPLRSSPDVDQQS